MKKSNKAQENLSLYSTKKENELDLILGLVIIFFVVWGLYIEVRLHL